MADRAVVSPAELPRLDVAVVDGAGVGSDLLMQLQASPELRRALRADGRTELSA